jgi:hypothetical protein
VSSKFFTNRDNNTLENRLKDILSHHQGITHGRILVGINVDKLTLEAKEAGVKFNKKDYSQEKR